MMFSLFFHGRGIDGVNGVNSRLGYVLPYFWLVLVVRFTLAISF